MCAPTKTITKPSAEAKSKNIIQIGCGVVGSAYMHAFRSKGHNVIGLEASPTIIENLRKSSAFEMYNIADDLSHLVDIDLIMISVCTPLKADDGRLDMSYIYSTLDNVAELVRNNPKSTVVIRSTVVSTYRSAVSASFSSL